MPVACRPSVLIVPVALAALAAPVAAQWSTDAAANLAIVSKSGEQVTPKVAATPDGSTWVAWFDNAAGSYDVYCQRLDAGGVPQFAAGGLLVSDHAQSTSLVDWDLISDKAGNAVLVFTDTRDGGDLDVFAYKLSPAGAMLWGADGVQLSANNDFEPAPRVCLASDGDLGFVWARLPAVGDGGLMMQRLSPAGVPELAPGGLLVVTQPGEDPAFCDVEPADLGSVIVSWVRDITTFASPRHVRARKFSATGAPQWPVVNVYDAAPVPIAHQPGLLADGAGGALLWWHRSDLSGNYSSFVQHLGAAGGELFPHNGVSVATTATNHIDPTLAYPQPGGDLYVFWNERNSLQSQWGISGQRLNAAGALQWGAGGLPLAALDSTFKGPPRTVKLGTGAGVFWTDEPTAQFGLERVLGRRVDAAGNLSWGPSPTVIASTLSTKSRLPVAVDAAGVTKLVWEDDRNGTPDLYGQSVRPDGSLGAWLSTWSDWGHALAGLHGLPVLAGSGLPYKGGIVKLALTNALENSGAFLIVGYWPAVFDFKGGVMVPAPDIIIHGLSTGPAGAFSFTASWPAGMPTGTPLWFQVWIIDAAAVQGLSATNGLNVVGG
jgi:hypothetical protein